MRDLYVAGARAALALARQHDCGFALLIDGNPPCGSGFICDGAFAGRKHVGARMTAALLRQHGIECSRKQRSTPCRLDCRRNPKTITFDAVHV
ncbi:hypothetical protein [Rhizobium sp. YS-1r]|uniref:hypothetical protein n=1 Tax=Rhizobium/Agrobacterium group TaxID=227290 RepID=UPI001FCC153C|nr:hypothetical protein [Rhizobium sp. YS-1r]